MFKESEEGALKQKEKRLGNAAAGPIGKAPGAVYQGPSAALLDGSEDSATSEEESTSSEEEEGAFAVVRPCAVLRNLVSPFAWNEAKVKPFVGGTSEKAYAQVGELYLQQLDLSEVKAGMELGSGNFGTAYCVAWQGAYVAVKQMQAKDKQALESILHEITQMAALSHPRLVNLYGVARQGEGLLIGMEFCPYGGLDKILEKARSYGGLSPKAQRALALDILAGLAYLHGQTAPVIHRDLAADNILLDNQLHAKIADFGLAMAVGATGGEAHWRPRWSAPEIQRLEQDIKNLLSHLRDNVPLEMPEGRRAFYLEQLAAKQDEYRALAGAAKDAQNTQAKEKLLRYLQALAFEANRDIFAPALDMFSFGKVLYEIVTCQGPQREYGSEGFPKGMEINEELKNLMHACWESDPNKRPTATEAYRQLSRQQTKATAKGATIRPVEQLSRALQEKAKKLQRPQLSGNKEVFVPLEHGRFIGDESRQDLAETLESFLTNAESKALLLLGHSGSGKSTALNRFVQHIATGEVDGHGRLPLYVSLPALESPETDCLLEFCKAQGFSDEEAMAFKQAKVPLLVVLDGYDEIATTANLWESNHFEEWDAKVIFGCRIQKAQSMPEGHRPRFYACDATGRPLPNAFQEVVLRPLSETQIQAYLKQHAGDEKWQETWRQLQQLNLSELVSNPLTLALMMAVLPSLSKRAKDQPLTRHALYAQFMRYWFEQQQKHFQAQGQLLAQGNDLYSASQQFAQKLAARMFEQGQQVVHYQASRHGIGRKQAKAEQAALWGEFFDDRYHPLKPCLRAALPLQQTGKGDWRWLHKSLWEHQVACVLLKELEQVSSGHVPNGLRLNQRLLNDELGIVQFMADVARFDESAQGKLFAIVLATRHDKELSIAAANSMTILNRAYVAFSGMDLSGVSIPHALLDGAIMDSANLRHADLSGATLQAAFLNDADLSDAELTNVKFAQMPSLQHPEGATALCVSPDGQFVATASGRCIYLWEWATGECVQALVGHMGLVWSVFFLPDGNRIASIGEGNIIKIWDAHSGACLHTTKIDESINIETCAFSPDGKQAVSGNYSNSMKVWDVYNGDCLHQLQGEQALYAPVFSPNGKLIAAGAGSNIIKIWDAHNGACLYTLKTDSPGNVRAVFSPDGKTMASIVGGAIQIWDIDSGACLRKMHGRGNLTCMAISSDGKQIVTGGLERVLEVWDVHTGNRLHDRAGHTDSIESVAFSPDGQWLFSVGGGVVKIWDLQAADCHPTLSGHKGGVESVAFSPDGKQVASGGGTVKMWDAQSGAGLRTFMGKHNSQVFYVGFSEDGKTITSVDGWDSAYTWEVESGSCLGTLDKVRRTRINKETVGAREISAAVRSRDEFYRRLNGRGGSFNSKNFVAVLGQGDECNIVKIYKCKERKTTDLCCTLAGHTSTVYAVAFSPDEKTIATASRDASIKLWRWHEHQQRYVLSMSIGGGYFLSLHGANLMRTQGLTGANQRLVSQLTMSGPDYTGLYLRLLAHAPYLARLDLVGVPLGHHVRLLTEFWQSNRALTAFHFGGNGFNEGEMEALATALASSFSLTEVQWEGVVLSEGAQTKITEMLKRNRQQRDAFLSAAEKGDIESVKHFVRQGVSVHQATVEGATALHLAAKSGHIEVVKWLLENGALPMTETMAGKTALHLARENGHRDVALYLLSFFDKNKREVRQRFELIAKNYEWAIALNPNDIPTRYNRAYAYHMRNEPNASIFDHLIKVFYATIADYDWAIQHGPAEARAYCGRANAFFGLNEYAKALADYDKALQLDPKNISAYTGRGDAQYALGKYAEAIGDYNEAIQHCPQNAEACQGRAHAQFVLGRYAEAIADYGQADYWGHGKTDVLVYVRRALAHCHLRNVSSALADLGKLIALDDKYRPIVAFVQAFALKYQGDWAYAISENEAILKEGPNNKAGLLLQCFAYYMADKIEEAGLLAQSALHNLRSDIDEPVALFIACLVKQKLPQQKEHREKDWKELNRVLTICKARAEQIKKEKDEEETLSRQTAIIKEEEITIQETENKAVKHQQEKKLLEVKMELDEKWSAGLELEENKEPDGEEKSLSSISIAREIVLQPTIQGPISLPSSPEEKPTPVLETTVSHPLPKIEGSPAFLFFKQKAVESYSASTKAVILPAGGYLPFKQMHQILFKERQAAERLAALLRQHVGPQGVESMQARLCEDKAVSGHWMVKLTDAQFAIAQQHYADYLPKEALQVKLLQAMLTKTT